MAVANVLISKVVDMLLSKIQQELKLVAGVEQEVQKLIYSLQSIRVVLEDAERRQWKETNTVQLWLDRLKSVAYDVDDVMDELSYEILKSQTQREENSRKRTSKLWSFNLLSAWSCFPKVVLRHQIAVKINNLNAKLDAIAMEKDRYGLQSLTSNVELVERYVTTSDIDITEVKGRDIEKEKLVSMLLSGGNEMSNLRLIFVVGMGGIGKTTLARLVYNDERVKSKFKIGRIWVCVLDPFDEIGIAKEILESIKGAKIDLDALPNIMKKIQESFIKGEEYLLVLDDVWNEDERKWKQLEDCLKGSMSKITILVTTRNENVARTMGCLESNLFLVGLLSEEESWELFSAIAFFRRSSEERAVLEELGRELVRRCKGLPLAIRALAGLLRFKKCRTEWLSVVDNELWTLEKVKRDVLAPLWLTYFDLPSHLKQCLLYCVVFPKDYEMEKDELIRHWIAQGYIDGTNFQDLEMIGEEYFQNLVMRSLFQNIVVDRDLSGITETRCKMHDIVHDFVRFLVKKECLSVKVNNDGEAISLDDSLNESLRHLSFSLVPCLDSVYNLKKLRSLILFSSKSLGLDLRKVFIKFTFLRSLVLRYCGIVEVPSNIDRLIHLRELDLSYNDKLMMLPDTTWKLYNLRILNLENTRIQSAEGVGKLTNLRHLKGTPFLLPKEMERLSGLRILHWVCIDASKDDFYSLKHLKNFNQLTGLLMIVWLNRGNGDVEDARQAQLKEKRHITHLHLHLHSKEEETKINKQQDEELVESLNMPPNLEFIRIGNYMGLRTPNWLGSLTFLKMIRLDGWKNIKHLPNNLGTLPCLEDLELFKFRAVREVGSEFFGMDEMVMVSSSINVPLFPKLKSLHFTVFNFWEKWHDLDEEQEMLTMSSLTYLKIDSWRNLKALPNFILKKTSLKLNIRHSDGLQLYLQQIGSSTLQE